MSEQNALLRKSDEQVSFDIAVQKAEMYAKSGIVPKCYQDKPSDILVVMELAQRLDIPLFEALNNIYIVNGRPSMSAQLAISLANTRGAFKEPISFYIEKEEGDLVCTARATLLNNNKEVTSTFSWKRAEKAGYTSKPVYRSHPENMLSYRAALNLIRLYCPEVMMGLVAKEEAITMDTAPVEVQEESNAAEELLEMIEE